MAAPGNKGDSAIMAGCLQGRVKRLLYLRTGQKLVPWHAVKRELNCDVLIYVYKRYGRYDMVILAGTKIGAATAAQQPLLILVPKRPVVHVPL